MVSATKTKSLTGLFAGVSGSAASAVVKTDTNALVGISSAFAFDSISSAASSKPRRSLGTRSRGILACSSFTRQRKSFVLARSF